MDRAPGPSFTNICLPTSQPNEVIVIFAQNGFPVAYKVYYNARTGECTGTDLYAPPGVEFVNEELQQTN